MVGNEVGNCADDDDDDGDDDDDDDDDDGGARLCWERTKVQMAEGQQDDGAPAAFKLPWWQPVSDLRRPPALP